MLYGHSQGNLTESLYKSFDVGVDSHNYYPWSWTQIKERINKVTIDFSEKDIDHIVQYALYDRPIDLKYY
jgi:hypothetical protein